MFVSGVRAETSTRTGGVQGYENEGLRGLKALGVRELSYKLAFLACHVCLTNPRVSVKPNIWTWRSHFLSLTITLMVNSFIHFCSLAVRRSGMRSRQQRALRNRCRYRSGRRCLKWVKIKTSITTSAPASSLPFMVSHYHYHWPYMSYSKLDTHKLTLSKYVLFILRSVWILNSDWLECVH